MANTGIPKFSSFDPLSYKMSCPLFGVLTVSIDKRGTPIAGDFSIAGDFYDESSNPPLWDNCTKSEKVPRYSKHPPL